MSEKNGEKKSDGEAHPLIDRLFDSLTIGGKIGAELFIRGVRGTKRGLERTIELMADVGDHLEKRLDELEGPQAVERRPALNYERRPVKARVRADATPHEPTEGEDGVLHDETFRFLDRPDADGDPPE